MSSTQPYKCYAHKTTFLCQKGTTHFEFYSNMGRHSFRHCFHLIPFGQLSLCLFHFFDSYWNLFWYLNNNLVKISNNIIQVTRTSKVQYYFPINYIIRILLHLGNIKIWYRYHDIRCNILLKHTCLLASHSSLQGKQRAEKL